MRMRNKRRREIVSVRSAPRQSSALTVIGSSAHIPTFPLYLPMYPSQSPPMTAIHPSENSDASSRVTASSMDNSRESDDDVPGSSKCTLQLGQDVHYSVRAVLPSARVKSPIRKRSSTSIHPPKSNAVVLVSRRRSSSSSNRTMLMSLRRAVEAPNRTTGG